VHLASILILTLVFFLISTDQWLEIAVFVSGHGHTFGVPESFHLRETIYLPRFNSA